MEGELKMLSGGWAEDAGWRVGWHGGHTTPEAETGHSGLHALSHFPCKTVLFPDQHLPSVATVIAGSLKSLIHKGEEWRLDLSMVKV